MYFNEKRKALAMETLKTCYDCAAKAGIRKYLFVNFGLLLGIVRENDFIPHDNDVDLCVLMDRITPQQQLKYFKLLEENELFFARKKYSFVKHKDGFSKNLIGSEHATSDKKVHMTWFSLRKRKSYPKFCHWFMFPWNGYYWHTKAGKWVSRRKFDPQKFGYNSSDDAILKGMPERDLKELMEIDFKGLKINIPKRYGSVLDWCYPGWLVPKKGGASSKKTVCIVRNWDEKKSWKIIIDAVI